MTAPRKPRKRKTAFKLPRSSIMFFVGIGLIINEAGSWNPAQPSIPMLITALLMCGYPVAEIADLFRNSMMDTWVEDDGQEEDPDPPSEAR